MRLGSGNGQRNGQHAMTVALLWGPRRIGEEGVIGEHAGEKEQAYAC